MSLRITCEFTGEWSIQLILTRPSNINESSDYLWIHRWVAQSTYLSKTFKYQWIFGLPVNSLVDGPCCSPWGELKTSVNLQLTWEFTGGWPIRLTLRRPSNIRNTSTYLWIHRWMAHAATWRRPSNIRTSPIYLWIHGWMAHAAYLKKTFKHH